MTGQFLLLWSVKIHQRQTVKDPIIGTELVYEADESVSIVFLDDLQFCRLVVFEPQHLKRRDLFTGCGPEKMRYSSESSFFDSPFAASRLYSKAWRRPLANPIDAVSVPSLEISYMIRCG